MPSVLHCPISFVSFVVHGSKTNNHEGHKVSRRRSKTLRAIIPASTGDDARASTIKCGCTFVILVG
jgi:hypothetical protein